MRHAFTGRGHRLHFAHLRRIEQECRGARLSEHPIQCLMIILGVPNRFLFLVVGQSLLMICC